MKAVRKIESVYKKIIREIRKMCHVNFLLFVSSIFFACLRKSKKI